MHDDVCSMLYRTNEVGRAERIVYDERNPVAVCDVGHSINVYDVAIGVSQCFDEYGFGVFLYGLFEIVEVFRVDECSGDAVCRQGVGGPKGCSCHRKWFWRLRCGHLHA